MEQQHNNPYCVNCGNERKNKYGRCTECGGEVFISEGDVPAEEPLKYNPFAKLALHNKDK